MNLEKLFLLRQSKGLTQDEMGEILGVKRVAISQWENTKEIIPLDKLNKCANEFGVSIDYILGLSDKKKSVILDDIDKSIVSENIKKIREIFGLSQRDLARILNTTQSTVWAYEKGKTLILTAFAYQLCKEYNISLDWLVGRSKDIYIK